jgi:DNA-binding transcriptional ArsR family regulator
MSKTDKPSTTASAKVIQLKTGGKIAEKKEKRRAEDKFSTQVMKHGYTLVPNLLLMAQSRLDISPLGFNVLMQLFSFWWDADRNPHPTKENIARRMGKSPRMVQRYITELEEAGYVKRIKRFAGPKNQQANAYALNGLVKKLIELEPEFAKVAEQRRLRQKKLETGAA